MGWHSVVQHQHWLKCESEIQGLGGSRDPPIHLFITGSSGLPMLHIYSLLLVHMACSLMMALAHESRYGGLLCGRVRAKEGWRAAAIALSNVLVCVSCLFSNYVACIIVDVLQVPGACHDFCFCVLSRGEKGFERGRNCPLSRTGSRGWRPGGPNDPLGHWPRGLAAIATPSDPHGRTPGPQFGSVDFCPILV